MVRKETAHFFWTSRRDDIDCRLLQHDQVINHYANAAAFATKVSGLRAPTSSESFRFQLLPFFPFLFLFLGGFVHESAQPSLV